MARRHRWQSPCLFLVALLLLVLGAHADQAEAAGSPQAVITIHFDFDKSTIRPPEKAILNRFAEQLVQWLDGHSDAKIVIEGHADGSGTAEYAIVQGEKMARSVQFYLAKLDVPEKRMKIISYGNERPLDPADTAEARAKNRRVEIHIPN